MQHLDINPKTNTDTINAMFVYSDKYLQLLDEFDQFEQPVNNSDYRDPNEIADLQKTFEFEEEYTYGHYIGREYNERVNVFGTTFEVFNRSTEENNLENYMTCSLEPKSTDTDSQNVKYNAESNVTKSSINQVVKNKVGRKPLNEGFIQRKDLVFKSFIRKMRQQLKYKFRFQFPIVKGFEHNNLLQNLVSFIEGELNQNATTDFIILLGSIIAPEGLKNADNIDINKKGVESMLKKVDSIQTTFHRFSLKRYNILLKQKGMHSIITHFLDHLDVENLSHDEGIASRMMQSHCQKLCTTN